jgi:uncharacterized protein YuzE
MVVAMESHGQSVNDPDGRRVVFDAGSHLHLAQGGRSWLLDHVETILTAVARPDYREDDPRPGRERFYRQNALAPGTVDAGYRRLECRPRLGGHGPGSGRRPSTTASSMSITIAGTTFETHHYDQRGDVLYLSVAHYEGPPAKAMSTPEGHGIEYDETGRVVGMTLTNVSWLLDRDGEITVTLPAGHVSPDDLAQALRPAA